jgi:hypothetical protein
MSAAVTQNVTIRLAAFDTDTGEPDFQPAVVIDKFDYSHNQQDSLLRPTSITWGDPVASAGRGA